MTGFFWTCSHCPAWGDGYEWDTQRDAALIQHTKRCRRCPPGTEVYRAGTRKLLYRKR